VLIHVSWPSPRGVGDVPSVFVPARDSVVRGWCCVPVAVGGLVCPRFERGCPCPVDGGVVGRVRPRSVDRRGERWNGGLMFAVWKGASVCWGPQELPRCWLPR